AGTAFAQAQPAPGRLARGIRAAMAILDLTDAQKEQVKAIFASHKDQFQTFRAQARANRQALRDAASAENPDPAAVGAAFLKVRSDAKAAKSQLESVHAEINGVLTPDQKSRLDGWIAAHKQQRRAAMHAFGEPPPAN
ncbi:MAG: Spy/CpxP family protein refolding chaperone, partial [Thermoanaerobaculia bacterium]